MTREEAIQELTEWREQMKNHGVPNWSAKLNALNMATEALSAEAVPQMEHDREWIIGCIKHDGFIHTHRFDKANQIILDALELADRPTEDYSDLPDIPRAYYEKIVGNMSHEINMLKQQLEDRPSGEWIPLDGKLPKVIGHHVLVTIKWADDDLEVCEMCPTVADRYNIIAFQELPEPYQGEQIKSELQCSGARMENIK